MSNLTLWDIEKGIAELFDAIEEAATPEGRQACEQALAEYFAREVVKVDAIRGMYKHFDALANAARLEANEIAERSRMFARRCERIKTMTQAVMEANGLTKIEGRGGRLLLKGNGGLAPLEVTDPAAVPDECCRMIGWIRGDVWKRLLAAAGWNGDTMSPAASWALERVVDNERTRAALKTCDDCAGTGLATSALIEGGVSQKCPACGGSGMGGVPGARLGERGKHVEVK